MLFRSYLSFNPNAIPILEKNLDKIDWYSLSKNPNAIYILEKNPDKIDWGSLSKNPNALHLLFDYDYEQMKENTKTLFCDLTEYVFHPFRLQRISELYGLSMEEYLEIV